MMMGSFLSSNNPNCEQDLVKRRQGSTLNKSFILAPFNRKRESSLNPKAPFNRKKESSLNPKAPFNRKKESLYRTVPCTSRLLYLRVPFLLLYYKLVARVTVNGRYESGTHNDGYGRYS